MQQRDARRGEEPYRGRRVVLRTETFLRAGEHLHVEWSGTRVACRQRLPAHRSVGGGPREGK